MAYMIGKTPKITPIWEMTPAEAAKKMIDNPMAQLTGTGAILTLPQKIAVIVGGTALAGLALFGGKQYLEQKQQQETEQAQKTQGGGFVFYTEPYGTVTVNQPQAGEASATQQATSAAQQQAEQTKPDYLQWLLIGGLGLGAIYFLTKKK
jgi:hypothetical protein